MFLSQNQVINTKRVLIKMSLPSNFTYLETIAPDILQDMKYVTADNFIGRPIPGYESNKCIMTIPTAIALLDVQHRLKDHGWSLKVFDAYRPQTAVDEFVRWSQDAADQKMKKSFYPNVNKADFFKLNYISAKSGHTRGSTVDLTIVRFKADGSHEELDMGTPFDFMDEKSHPFTHDVSNHARNNRLFFRDLMLENGFVGIETEWWHFTLKQEPFPDTYFDFPVS